MKRIFAFLFLALATLAHAAKPAAPTLGYASSAGICTLATPPASAHANALCWTASPDSTTAAPGTANVYRHTGACQTTDTITNFTKIASSTASAGVAGAPFEDASAAAGTGGTLTPGINCYGVTAVIGGAESGLSGTLQLTTPTFPPGTPTGTAY